MFTPDERASIRAELVDRARADGRIAGAAITGSAATGREDEWSDIDLAFAVAEGVDVADVLADWSGPMYERHRAVHHLDVAAGSWTYRVFLLANSLQVDLAFVPARDFRALAPSFQLLFGEAQQPLSWPEPVPNELIGYAWLHALHARSAIARGRYWQAEYMISGVRDHALALACVRRGLPAAHGRGMDLLPGDVLARAETALVRALDGAELRRAFRGCIEALMFEIQHADAGLAARLKEPFREMTAVCD